MSLPIPTPVVTTVAIVGRHERFPIRRVFCVGRNYAEHAVEMGHDPQREAPFFFMKPADAVVEGHAQLAYPRSTSDLHHEIELVAALGRGGADIDPAVALEHVFGYAVGLDMTKRDIQAVAKKQARPWDLAKGFDASAPLSAIVCAGQEHPQRGAITLDVNGVRRQTGDLAQMIWPLPDIIAFLSKQVVLQPGDLVFTGTPAGVGPVAKGDTLHGVVEGVGEIMLTYC
jgi:fumarylpyruvate hydrolase